MISSACVPTRVTVRRVVTAQGDSAFLTSAQVHPAIAGLNALLAHLALGFLYRFYGGQMSAN